MDLAVSVFFNFDRAYLAAFESTPKGLKLKYINSTTHPLEFEGNNEKSIQKASGELKEMAKDISGNISRMSITLPGDNIIVNKIPGSSDLKFNEIRSLVDHDIRQIYPQFSFKEFVSNVFPMPPDKSGREMMLAVTIPKSDLDAVSRVIKSLRPQIDHTEVAQINAHDAFLYNYPERADQSVVIMGIGKEFIDVSVIKSRQAAYYDLSAYTGNLDIVIREQMKNIQKNVMKNIDAIFLYGAGLNKESLENANETAEELNIELKRMNAFRMMTTDISPREREYCSRVQHIYPPVVGGVIPSYHERIKLY